MKVCTLLPGRENSASHAAVLAAAVSESMELLNTNPSAVILAPTETVYGLLCDWDSMNARGQIYRLKHRPQNKMLAAFMPNLKTLKAYVAEIPETACTLAEKFCPGPVTLVIPDGKGSTFGFRIPDHPYILALLNAYARPLASTSANRSGTPAALSVNEALATLDGSPELVIDGGPIAAASKASTVIQIDADNHWKILRPGPISATEIINALRR